MKTNEKIRILLADDDEDDCGFFREALDQIKFPYELICVNNGEKTIDFFKSTQRLPDFVFLDINMPRLNGMECLKLITNNYPNRNFHVIMLSTATAPSVIEQSYRLGASLYIQKPSKFNDLAMYLQYCLTRLKKPATQSDFILNDRFDFG